MARIQALEVGNIFSLETLPAEKDNDTEGSSCSNRIGNGIEHG